MGLRARLVGAYWALVSALVVLTSAWLVGVVPFQFAWPMAAALVAGVFVVSIGRAAMEP